MFICLFFIALCTNPIPRAEIDSKASRFEMREKKQVEVFDFSGEFPNLENIDIDARRKMRVEMNLSGNFPMLESITYEGSFGDLKGKITGSFPKLEAINLLCTSTAMQLDLDAPWQKDCAITIRGAKEDILVNLPKSVALVVNTRTSAKGKVIAPALKKKGWGLLNKTFIREEPENPSVLLTIHIEVSDGKIILN